MTRHSVNVMIVLVTADQPGFAIILRSLKATISPNRGPSRHAIVL